MSSSPRPSVRPAALHSPSERLHTHTCLRAALLCACPAELVLAVLLVAPRSESRGSGAGDRRELERGRRCADTSETRELVEPLAELPVGALPEERARAVAQPPVLLSQPQPEQAARRATGHRRRARRAGRRAALPAVR
eukprot:1364321-Prymnesium_polylepis.1